MLDRPQPALGQRMNGVVNIAAHATVYRDVAGIELDLLHVTQRLVEVDGLLVQREHRLGECLPNHLHRRLVVMLHTSRRVHGVGGIERHRENLRHFCSSNHSLASG